MFGGVGVTARILKIICIIFIMNWYDLEIQLLENTYADKVNSYNHEMDRSDSNAGFDLFTSMNVKIENQGFIPFGIVARLVKVDKIDNEYIKTDSHFWLMPRSSIYKSGLIMANSTGVIDKSYRGELKAPVWSMMGEVEVNRNDRHFQIVAPDMGWIRNVSIVDSLPQTERSGFDLTGN